MAGLVRVRAVGALLGAMLVLVPLVGLELGRTSGGASGGTLRLPGAVTPAGLADRSGVRVVRVASTGGGGLLDLRYQVIDEGSAEAVHDASTPPALVDEKSGLVVSRLLMGHMHHGRQKAGVTYYLIFVNSGNVVRAGDRVAVVLGAARLQHVLVR
jgi:hypothetical protein